MQTVESTADVASHAFPDGTWLKDIADWLHSTPASAIPAPTRKIAARQVLDSIACAIGALDHEAPEVMGRVVRTLGGTPESSLVAEPERTSALHAILYNGSLVRALDCNDAFVRGGPGGHPSDNIVVAMAFAERERASGAEMVRAIALGYELFWRLRSSLFRDREGPAAAWDGVSASGFVAAAMAGLLLRLDRDQLAHALAIGGAQTYSIAEIRRGEISMLKASANAIAAHVGALGALLAAHGMTGPAELIEGSRGLLWGLEAEATPEQRHYLTQPVTTWHIDDISIKLFPAVATSQSALAATLDIVSKHAVQAADVERIEVRFPDTPTTHEHLADEARRNPRTRETADHSIPFLVAAAVEDGELGPAQFRDQRWFHPRTRELMGRVNMSADGRLNATMGADYPAAVTIVLRNGTQHTSEMLKVPGSPSRPLTDEELGQKLRRLAAGRLTDTQMETIQNRVLSLEQVADVTEIGDLLRDIG